MPRQRVEPARTPTHEEVKARNPLKGKTINSYKAAAELNRLCTSVGLGTSGTIADKKRDLTLFKALDWGGAKKKVTVSQLRAAQGPSSIFDGVPRTPESTFDIFFNDAIVDLLVEETNRYTPKSVRYTPANSKRIFLTVCSLRPSPVMISSP